MRELLPSLPEQQCMKKQHSHRMELLDLNSSALETKQGGYIELVHAGAGLGNLAVLLRSTKGCTTGILQQDNQPKGAAAHETDTSLRWQIPT